LPLFFQSGTLRLGDDLGVRDCQYGRVRAMQNWKSDALQSAPPSTPVKIIGWKLAPAVGDIMEVPENARGLKKIKATDVSMRATEEMASIKHLAKEEEIEGEDGKQIVNLIIRADVLGSLEAILGMLDKIQHENVGVKVVQKGLGNITEADVNSAQATHAILVGFNVYPSGGAEELAREKNVSLRLYKIIYKLFEDVIDELKKRVPTETIIHEQGRCVVLKNFRKTDNGWIIGVRIKGEKILPGAKLRLSRFGEYIGEGTVKTLQLGNSQLKEGQPGQECGMQYEGKIKPEENDEMEAYGEEKKVKQFKLEGINLR